MKNVLIEISLALTLIVSFPFASLADDAETIPYEKLVGVWTLSQDGANHKLTKAQVSELCGMGLFIIHPNRNNGIHIRIKRDGKLMMSMDVLSKNPCTYDDNHLSCEMEATYFGKSIGVSPGFFVFQKVGDGLYDVTTLKPDGKTVDKVQTMYPCSMTVPEAQDWVEANSGPGEIGEKLGETINTLEQLTPQIEGGKKKKIELLKKQVKSGDGWAQAGLGTLHLMAAIKNIGVEHDPERGLALLKEAAEKKLVSAYVMLGNANMIPGLAFPKQNYVTAFGWYEKAAQTGRGDALNTAGMMKLFGLGTNQDGPQAVEWLTRASEQGNPSAHFNLGIIRVFFPKELKQRWKVSLEQDPVTGMMHINLAAEQGHEPSKMMLQFLNQKRHPKLAYPAQAKANLWKKNHPRKLARNRDYPDSTIEMEFKIEGGQIKFMDANINAKLVWSLVGGSVDNQDNVQKNVNKKFLLNKWWGFDGDCGFLILWDDEGNEYGLYNKETNENPMQRYINEKWWIATYGKLYIGDYYMKGKFFDKVENNFTYFDLNYKFKTRNNRSVPIFKYLEFSKIDKNGNIIKEDVSGWGEIELLACKISNIRETKEFSTQLEHIKKIFNKK